MSHTKTLAVITLLAAFLAPPCFVPAQDRAEVELRTAMEMETVKGDLKGAIALYSKLAKGSNRPVAAKALVQMGQCYEKLGQADARAAYERVIKEFADQSEQVQAARARLAALGGTQNRTAGTDITVRRLYSGPAMNEGPPSPDGRYLSLYDPDSGDLAIQEIATGQKRRLTNKGAWSSVESVGWSIWSPDSKKIAYAWLTKDMTDELRIIGVDGTGLRTLSAGYPLDWSRDGRLILGITLKTKSSPEMLVLVSVADGTSTPVGTAERPISSWDACFSADGKRIVYDSP